MQPTMAFFMPCCKRFRQFAARLLLGVLVLVNVCYADDGASVKAAEIRAARDGFDLVATIALHPNTTLEDALQKGIALHFVIEVEISKPHGWWLSWWFNEGIGDAVRRTRIYYNFLLRRYIVDAGYVTRTADTLERALAIMGRVDDWQILEPGALKPGLRYVGRVRVRLDPSQLAKPLQINALANTRWELASPWYEWTFDAPAVVKPAPLLP
jgi:hypothetical protein